MSAILGILRLDGGPVDHHALAPLIEALQAYGPDRQGVWVSGSIGLGQLLMQITPEDAGEQQPLSSVSGRFSLVADVRLDNRDTLTERLGLSAAQGRTWTDSAFVLAAFEKWGVEAFPQLLGGLAGALWDTSEQRLYLVRDVMGERPLFYYRSERCFVFASAFQGLFAHPQVPRLLNAAKLADYLLLNANDRSSTVYTHIHRLSPGQALSIDSAGHCRTWQYDDLMPGDETRLPSDAAYAEALREQFERAVVRRLRCRKSVGSHLSSGLDSSSVACVAANDLSRQQRRLQAYTWVPAVDLSDPPPLSLP